MNKKLWLALSLAFLAAGVVLCLPVTHNFLISAAEKFLSRQLNQPSLWKFRIIAWGAVRAFIVSLVFCYLYMRKNDSHRFDYHVNNTAVFAGTLILMLAIFVLPLVIFGQDSAITIHDNLDDSIPRFHYIHEHNLFWTFGKELPLMNGTSTLFFNREGFTLYNAVYCLFPTYQGYVIHYALCVTLGFIFMLWLQRIIFKNENIILISLTSAAYALLPTVCTYALGVATMPFAVIIFYKLLTTNQKRWLIPAFIYPFISNLSGIALFVIGFWLLALLVLSIKQRRLNVKLLLGLILMCMGVCVTDSRLIYMRFVLHEPLNRDFFSIESPSFIISFLQYLFAGYYHSATLQYELIDWVVLITAFIMWRKDKTRNYYKTVMAACLSLSLFCAFIAALSEAGIMGKIVNVIFPPLKGIQLTRIYTAARLSWYAAFTTSLLYTVSRKKYADLAYMAAVLQIVLIFISPAPYNDSLNTWRRNLIGGEDITWREFYSEKQFDQIKQAINYNGEKVCAVGYHPGVLLYNNFNTIDGYLSVYPYEQQVMWHNLLIPEFERNERDRKYFDSWGGRRYVYNKDLPYAPIRNKSHEGVNLYIDMKILKADYDCKYILSRAELLNSEELGLNLAGKFDSPESIYVMWVYRID